jgi:hypothetical protein
MTGNPTFRRLFIVIFSIIGDPSDGIGAGYIISGHKGIGNRLLGRFLDYRFEKVEIKRGDHLIGIQKKDPVSLAFEMEKFLASEKSLVHLKS